MSEGDRIVIREGGVYKTIKRVGPPSTLGTPTKGKLVYVHYTGTLEDGTVFDSSRQGGRRPLQFNLGESQVILGWDLAVATMQVGELSVIEIAPEYGYGSIGAGSAIPPNAKLTFEVELLHFEEGRNGMGWIPFLALVAVGLGGIYYSMVHQQDGLTAVLLGKD